jgi:hypothetical protein
MTLATNWAVSTADTGGEPALPHEDCLNLQGAALMARSRNARAYRLECPASW